MRLLFTAVFLFTSLILAQPAARTQQIPVNGVGAPNNNTCNVAALYGNLYFDTTTAGDLYICGSSGWSKTTGSSVSLTGGTGISVSPNPITGVGVITNTSPSLGGTVTSVSGTANQICVATGTTTPVLSICTALDLSGLTSTKPIKSGTSLPATCGVGEFYDKTDASAGSNLYSCTATNTWTVVGGGASPAGSVPQLQYKAGTSSFGAVDPTFIRQFLTSIPDPSPLVVSKVGAGTGTTWGYVVVQFNGVGWTLPSAETTEDNAATLSFGGGMYNTITLPNSGDSQITCAVIRTSGPNSPKYVLDNAYNNYHFGPCDGSVIRDAANGSAADNVTLPTFNSTAGVLIGNAIGLTSDSDGGGDAGLIFGGPIPENPQMIKMFTFTQDLGAMDAFGNQISACGPDAPGLSWFCSKPFRAPTLTSQNLSANDVTCTDANGIFVDCPIHGNTTRVQTSDNTGTSGNLAQYDANGNVTDGPSATAASFVTYSTATNCSNAASPAACGSAAAGAVAIPTGVTSVSLVVNTSAITASSEIFLQSDDTLTIAATTCNSTLATLVGGLAITARSPGTSFTITYNGTIATNKLCVSYRIEN